MKKQKTASNQPFDRDQFINQLIKELEISMNSAEELKIRQLLNDRLDDFLLTTLFDSLGTAEVRMLHALQEQFPEISTEVHLLAISQTIPDLMEKIHDQTAIMRNEVLFLAEKIREIDKKDKK